MVDQNSFDTADSELRAIFIEEAREQLEILDQGLVRLEREPQNVDLIQTIFRAAHTIKGSSGAMGFTPMASLTHAMEDVLDQIREGKLAVSPTITDHLLNALDTLRELQRFVEAGQDEQLQSQDITLLTQELRTLATGKQDTADHDDTSTAAELPELPPDQIALLVQFSADCHMPGIRAYMILRALGSHGDIVQTDPSAEELDRGEVHQRLLVVVQSDEPDDLLRGAVNTVSEVEWVRLARGADAKGLRIDLPNRQAPRRLAAASTDASSGHEREISVQSTMRVSIETLDRIMNLVGELVLDRTRVAQIKDELREEQPQNEHVRELDIISQHLGNIVSELHEHVFTARMLPIDNLFNRFPRLVRDLCRSMHKEIDLLIDGESALLDRTIIERLVDPITHILRNAIDHGMESPDERERLGKPRCGTIHLSAQRHEEHILLTISDNGPGLDIEHLKRKALEKGLMSPERIHALNEQEAKSLIFSSGLSTAKSVTDVSGRGVGMDVVKKNLDSLGGSVIVQSQPGEGTAFVLKVPLTLAIMRALIVNVGETAMAIPLQVIEETLRVPRTELQYIQSRPFLQWRDMAIPVVNLAEVFQGSDAWRQDTIAHLLVIRYDGQFVCFSVNSIRNHQEVVVRPLGAYFGEVPGLAGGTILGNGQVALVLDIGKLFQSNFRLATLTNDCPVA